MFEKQKLIIMKKKNRQIILWTLIAMIAIILVIVIKNIDSFIEGFRAGGELAK